MWKFFRTVGWLYIWAWLIVIVVGIIVAGVGNKTAGMNIIAMGAQVLFVVPVSLVGGGLAKGLSPTGNVDQAAFNLGQALGLIVIAALIAAAIFGKSKKKKGDEPTLLEQLLGKGKH